MTKDEAQIIAKIAATADGGCSVCVRGIAGYLMHFFPEHDWKSFLVEIAVRKKEYWDKEVPNWTAAGDDADRSL